MEQRRRILGVRRENPSGGLRREEVKLHPIKSLGEEAEQETRVRLSIFYSLSLCSEEPVEKMMRRMNERSGLSYSVYPSKHETLSYVSVLDPLQLSAPELLKLRVI